MKLWRVVLLLNLALGVGLLLGYLAWGRQIPRLQGELERASWRAPAPGVEQSWVAEGVVRAVLPEIDVLVLTHDDIPGFMPPMTMGFRAKEPAVYAGVEVGDAIRFTLRGVPPNVVITEIVRRGKS